MRTSNAAQTYIRLYYIIMCLQHATGKLTKQQKIKFCQNIRCDDTGMDKVCGIRKHNGMNKYRLFDNECSLLKYGCQVDDEEAYGIINMKYCIQDTPHEVNRRNCPTNCTLNVKEPVCGIRKNGDGFSIKIFTNKCQLSKYNCEQQLQFSVTDFFICNGLTDHKYIVKRRNNDEEKVYMGLGKEDEQNSIAKENEELDESHRSTEETNGTKISNENAKNLETSSLEVTTEETTTENISIETYTTLTNSRETYNISTTEANNIENITTILPKHLTTNSTLVNNKTIHKNIVVIRTSLSDLQHINATADNFFAATHVFDLPIREMHPNVTERTRRMLLKAFGPIMVFKPFINIPKTIIEDHYHTPTLSSCFHKCPRECPDTYAPVCGMPGTNAREPSLMFQNHCFMDVAQCKMFWEDKSETALSSAYTESSFLFCLGQELSSLYRFLPLVRTLQHMGRLKSKGKFKYKFRNMRFFNQLMARQPNIMG